MDIFELEETIRKHITIIKKTIVKPINLDVVIKVPKKNGQRHEEKSESKKEYTL
jgi:hypothetical protein